MEKSLKVSERAHMKPRYFTLYLTVFNSVFNFGLLQNPHCMFEDVYMSLIFLSSCPSLSQATGLKAELKVPYESCLLKIFEATSAKELLFTGTL